MASNKKLYVALVAGITASLRKAYDALNKDGHYPEVENDQDLIPIAGHIYRGLQKTLLEIAENERFDGMSYEQILEAKEAEKEKAIKRMQEESAEALRAMRPAPEVVADVDDLGDEDPDSDQDGDDLGDDDPDGDQDGDDQDGDQDDDDLIPFLSSEERGDYAFLVAKRAEYEMDLKMFEIGTDRHTAAANAFIAVNDAINSLEGELKKS